MVYDLGNGQWDIPELRTLLEKILPDSWSFDDYEVEHEFREIGRRIMVGFAGLLMWTGNSWMDRQTRLPSVHLDDQHKAFNVRADRV